MKRKVGLIVLLLMTGIVLLVGCFGGENLSKNDNKKINIVEVVQKIKTDIEMRATEKIDDELAKEKFHLNLDDINEYIIENGLINSGLETIAIVNAKDKNKANDVSDSFKKVIEDKKLQQLYPGEAESLENAKVVKECNYVALFIIPDYEGGEGNSEKAVEIFESYFK